MNLVEQLRNQIRGFQKADSDILQAIAQGVKEELSRKYLLFEFMADLRPVGWGQGWKVELSATLTVQFVNRLIFKVIFNNDKCVLHGGTMPYKQHISSIVQEFAYEDPDMLDQLYLAISKLPSVPK